MKEIIKKFATYRNIFWLLYIVFYLVYVGVNVFNNRGNYYINIILLILTGIYLLLYIYSAFITMNKKMKKNAKKIFVKSKKFIAFVNASMVLASVISSHNNSFFTIFLAVVTLLWYLMYLAIDIISTLALHEFKKYTKNLGWKYDNRN